MADTSRNNILDVTGVQDIADGLFESIRNPERMGETPNAYSGFAVAVACMTAHQRLPQSHRLHSFSGVFLRAPLTDRKLRCRVREDRTTSMFTTRAVIVTQKLDDNKEQTCLIALADFQSIERKELFKYSKPPSTKYKGPYEVLGLTARNEWLLKEGRISPEMATMHTNFFDLWTRMFKIRPCDEGIFAQTLSGLIKDVPTTQEALPLTDRISADWWRCRTPLTDPAEHISTLAFLMSGGLDIVPLMHQRKFLDESGPCFALDFSLRVFSNEIDATEWHLREWKTIAAGAGRTYSEAQLWDERGDMVATMTQASILRPKSAGRSRL